MDCDSSLPGKSPEMSFRTTLSKRSLSVSNCAQQIATPRTRRVRLVAVRLQSASATSRPLPTDSTSKSEGLYPQVHPSGRPPLSPKTTTVSQAKPANQESPAIATRGYRMPLRTAASNIPVRLEDGIETVYEGPFRAAVRRLKAFSISSLILSTTMAPVILSVDAPIPHAARLGIIAAGTTLFSYFSYSLSALGASVLSTGLIHYLLTPYVARAKYYQFTHQLNLQTYSLFARTKNNLVDVDDLQRISGEGLRALVNVKNNKDGKVFYVHSEADVSGKFWETLDRPRGGYKTVTGKTMRYKEKIGDGTKASLFEQPPKEEVKK